MMTQKSDLPNFPKGQLAETARVNRYPPLSFEWGFQSNTNDKTRLTNTRHGKNVSHAIL